MIQLTFWNGNNWFIIRFDHEEDLISCRDKINEKEKDLIKFIQLSPKIKDKEKEENNISQQLLNKTHNNNKEKPSSSTAHTKTTKSNTGEKTTTI